jgi:hypothetical protein
LNYEEDNYDDTTNKVPDIEIGKEEDDSSIQYQGM